MSVSTKQNYRTTVYLGIVNGKKIRKTIRANSKRELNKKIKQAKQDSDNAVLRIENQDNTFGKWAVKWLVEYKIPIGLSEGTITEYRSAIKHINRYFENTLLQDITLSDFQKIVNDLMKENPNTKKPASKRTLENIRKVASAIFRYASSNNVSGVPHFFSEIVISRKAPQMKRRALTYEEQQMIINTPHRCQLPAMIMMFSGLRRGELIPLMWSDIDLKNGYISVTKSVEMPYNKALVKEGGKTESAIRKTAIPPILVDYLKKIKRNSISSSALVCTNTKGEMHSKSSFSKMWSSYLKDLNIKYGFENRDVSKFNPNGLPMRIAYFTPHYLRHTYATILYLQGVDMVTAKQYLGHADVQTTINIYTDLKNNSLLNITDSYKDRLCGDYKIRQVNSPALI